MKLNEETELKRGGKKMNINMQNRNHSSFGEFGFPFPEELSELSKFGYKPEETHLHFHRYSLLNKLITRGHNKHLVKK